VCSPRGRRAAGASALLRCVARGSRRRAGRRERLRDRLGWAVGRDVAQPCRATVTFSELSAETGSGQQRREGVSFRRFLQPAGSLFCQPGGRAVSCGSGGSCTRPPVGRRHLSPQGTEIERSASGSATSPTPPGLTSTSPAPTWTRRAARPGDVAVDGASADLPSHQPRVVGPLYEPKLDVVLVMASGPAGGGVKRRRP
jgi:hypothetical protein